MSAVRRGAAALLAAALLTACGANGSEPAATLVGGDDDGMHGAVLAEQYVVPTATLTDTAGRPFSLAASTHKPLTLVFFGYTNCPDICQMVMADLASAMTRLDDEQRSQVDVVLVTTDPARDDAETLRAYLDRFDPSFLGLTGDLATIKAVGKDLGVYIGKGQQLPSGGYEVDHSTPILGIDSRDRVPIVWTQGTSAADLAEDVAALLDKEGS
ncbi:MAG TPA: SCO family protein [Nocardioides sp.]|uniref:SCO family protein n=1 Tax=Nocardioides sp. TaxID=35761 RepID=UPI002BAE1967|nr:SCO family protein [Nocardioides sp.]HQR25939.1 SCO family protein [Nocardioides sp.]